MSNRAIAFLKAGVHALCLLPALLLLRMYFKGTLALEADPVNYITHFTGDWALWMLLGSLAITPLRRLYTGLSWTIRLRRMIGLYAFFYATLHLLTYVLLFSGYDVPAAMACIHYCCLVKTGVRTPWKVTAVLTLLLVMRVGYAVWKRMKVGKVVVA